MLTNAESKWLKKLQKVLNECPSDRLGFYTIGDEGVFIYDKSFDAEINEFMNAGKDFCIAVYELDADLDHILFPSNVHSTAG
ncbi:hypothetical protein KUG47_11895 [Falsochrobactrum sp. TDYN1]|uniref:Uncharacterized protein n=1 Tax=Falsochrobactrum tianjinense TaxID=2706015 RepID=A0A949UTU6_9HYPH|nr:hypothetical protein [Falsochrobactrum sp. TDYN1]MBV2144195.1 hypothetical protein [Falsochrobactrum sp. TDYN1]